MVSSVACIQTLFVVNVMDDTEIINQALSRIIDTELVAKQLEQAFKDASFTLIIFMMI